MTMRITIKNEDDQRTALVHVEEFELGKTAPKRAHGETLGPGKQTSVYIHANKRITVTEDPNAMIPKSPGRV